jgi:class 3 adenylate cyclase/tetratricopeptide (TPR) repeat protein
LICSNCGTQNAAGRKFCLECAAPLAVTCPTCGAANEPVAKFCGDCAAPLQPAVSAPARSPLATAPLPERRLVSVLFADLVGFTPFAEERDPEAVRELLSRYFDTARLAIERHGGTVEKFIGDAVMAAWGTPVAFEDDAERAVRAALELVDAIKDLGPGIQARAGVLTGDAAVDLTAVGQGMVTGDLVNTAARLQSVAAPGTVLVGEATLHAASAAIAFEPVGDQVLKGKTAPVAAWRALRVIAQRGGQGRVESLEPPFVGRDEELRLLKDLVHTTGREHRTRLVSITGPAGIGKSRLAWELEKYIDGVVENIYWHRGRSPSYGEGITFWALGEMVRRRARLAETDDEGTTRSGLAAAVAEYVDNEADRRWVEPALLTLLGLEPAPPGGRDVLFGAWRIFFEHVARRGPTVLLFEDLHWADTGLLDFIEHVLEWSKGAPILIFTLARPELFDRRPDWGSTSRHFTSMALEPLPEPAMRQLLGGLVPDLPQGTVRAILGRADGIPLYAVEIIRALIADGRLTRQGDSYQAIGDMGEVRVPDTLRSLIASRLDALEPADRALLQDASVLGQTFTLRALAAVSGESQTELEGRLRALVRREILALEVDPRSPERGQYGFVQSLIREVAYGTLGRRDRRARHLAVARHYEAVGDEETAGALASHYLAAHQASAEGEEANAVAAQARLALRAAAERAAALGAHTQAVTFLDQALTVTGDPAEKAELLVRAGDSASAAGRHDAAERYLGRAIEVTRAIGDRVGTARASADLGRILITGRHGDVALALLEAARAEFADLEGDPALASVGAQLARAHYLTGNLPRAIELADPVLRTAEHLDLVPIVADTLVTKGSALAQDGRSAEGLALVRAGQELAEKHGQADTLMRAVANRVAFESARDPRAALEIGRAGIAASLRLGQRNALLIANTTAAAWRVGEWAWGVELLGEALAEDFESADRAELLAGSVAFHACLGDLTDEMIAEMERLLAGATDAYRITTLDWAKGWVAFVAGRLGEARERWRRGIELLAFPESLPYPARAALWDRNSDAVRVDLADFEASGLHGPALEADRTTIRAGVAALEGRVGDALALYREAFRAWRDLGLAWDEALCAVDMVTVLDPSVQEVSAAAESARQVLTRLGTRPILERLEAALQRDAAIPVRDRVRSETMRPSELITPEDRA